MQLIYTHRSITPALEIEKRIEDDAKVFGLMLKKHFPFSENLPKSGFEIKEHASVFELCKGAVATKLLNTQPELNILMPCRISIYQKENEVFIATPNLEVQLEMFECDESLKKDILELYQEIVTLINKY